MSALWTGSGQPPPGYLDLVLCRDVYHCTPEELDRQDDRRIQEHLELMAAEAQVREMKSGRGDGRAPPRARKTKG